MYYYQTTDQIRNALNTFEVEGGWGWGWGWKLDQVYDITEVECLYLSTWRLHIQALLHFSPFHVWLPPRKLCQFVFFFSLCHCMPSFRISEKMDNSPSVLINSVMALLKYCLGSFGIFWSGPIIWCCIVIYNIIVRQKLMSCVASMEQSAFPRQTRQQLLSSALWCHFSKKFLSFYFDCSLVASIEVDPNSGESFIFP